MNGRQHSAPDIATSNISSCLLGSPTRRSFRIIYQPTLRGYVDDFCVVYLDDILIFSKSIGEHQQHLELVIERLHRAELPNSTPTPRNANSSKLNSNILDSLSTNN